MTQGYKGSNTRGRRSAIAGFVVLLVVLAVCAYQGRDDLYLEWLKWRAAKDLAAIDFRNYDGEPPEALVELLEHGEKGYWRIARLLVDKNEHVWRAAVRAIDDLLVGEEASADTGFAFFQFLPAAAPLAFVRYMIWATYSHDTAWRSIPVAERQMWNVEPSLRPPGGAVAISIPAIEFLEEVIRGRPLDPKSVFPPEASDSSLSKRNAVFLLAVLLDSASQKPIDTDTGLYDKGVGVLAEVASQDPNLELRGVAQEILNALKTPRPATTQP